MLRITACHVFDHDITILTRHEQAVAIISPASLSALRLPFTRSSRFLPVSLHWSDQTPCHDPVSQREAPPPPWFATRIASSPPCPRTRSVVRPIPSFHVTTVISKRDTWFRHFKHHIGQAARVILDGKLCIPCDIHEGSPLDAPNLKSCFESQLETTLAVYGYTFARLYF